MRALEFFGGCPQLVVPDNTRTGVSRACRYEPDLNPTYQEMAMHYAIGARFRCGPLPKMNHFHFIPGQSFVTTTDPLRKK